MEEVRAATNTATKNSIAAIALSSGAPVPILAKMKGRVSKMSPGPAPGSMPAAKTAGITAKPASIANIRSKNAVPSPDPSRSSSFFTNEEYVSMVPTPSDREKKDCPIAEVMHLPSILEKSGFSIYCRPSAEPGRLTE